MNQTGTGSLQSFKVNVRPMLLIVLWNVILNKNRHSTYIISNLVTGRFNLGNFGILCLREQ